MITDRLSALEAPALKRRVSGRIGSWVEERPSSPGPLAPRVSRKPFSPLPSLQHGASATQATASGDDHRRLQCMQPGGTMPWTTPHVREEREQFVIQTKNKDRSFKGLCRAFGISRPTGYRWVNRYAQVGNLRDLSELGRRPHHVANKTSEAIEKKVLEARDNSGLGAKKIASQLRQQNIRLAASTVHCILQRHGRVGAERVHSVPWIIKVLLSEAPLPFLEQELPGANELSELVHFLNSGRLSERKKAMTVLGCLKGIRPQTIANCLQIHRRAVTRYFNRYNTAGTSALFCRRKAKRRDDEKDKQLVFSLLHSPPSSYNINRTSWKMDDLQRVLRQTGHQMSQERIRKLIKAAG